MPTLGPSLSPLLSPFAALVLAAAAETPKETPPPAQPAGAEAPGTKAVQDALRRGVALLLERQESLDDPEAKPAERREWPYEGVYRVNREIPLGYRIGGTAIAAQAIVEAQGGTPAGEARAAVERGLAFVLDALEDPLMGPGFVQGYDVRGWGHAYALGFLLRLRAGELVPAAEEERVERWIDALVELLQTTDIGQRGGWNYSRPRGDESDPSTFMTAPTLQILFEARAQGEAVKPEVVERALQTLEDARLDTGAFQYGSTTAKKKSGKGFEDVPGAIGRMPVCETTLLLAGRGSVERVRSSIDAFFEHWEWLEKRRKQTGTHVPPYMIAPYYFFYAHRYTAQAIEMLPEGERPDRRARLLALLWRVREEDGGWNDRVFPRSEAFGTAMTLFALREPELPRPAGWRAPATKER